MRHTVLRALSPARQLDILRQNRAEILVWAVALVLFVVVVMVLTASLFAGPIPPDAAEQARAFRADYLAPSRIFSAAIAAPLIETWLIVKGVDALHDLKWRDWRALLVVALVAALMHFFVRGAFSALYNACFFALMARIYLKSAYENEKRGENRPVVIVLLIAMHVINNAVALGMIGYYARIPG